MLYCNLSCVCPVLRVSPFLHNQIPSLHDRPQEKDSCLCPVSARCRCPELASRRVTCMSSLHVPGARCATTRSPLCGVSGRPPSKGVRKQSLPIHYQVGIRCITRLAPTHSSTLSWLTQLCFWKLLRLESSAVQGRPSEMAPNPLLDWPPIHYWFQCSGYTPLQDLVPHVWGGGRASNPGPMTSRRPSPCI